MEKKSSAPIIKNTLFDFHNTDLYKKNETSKGYDQKVVNPTTLYSYTNKDIVEGKRLPMDILDPYLKLIELPYNHPREFWACRLQAFSSIKLVKTVDQGKLLQEKILKEPNPTDPFNVSIALSLYELFLSCPCVEDQRAVATLLFFANVEILDHFHQSIIQSGPLVYIIIRTLNEYASSVQVRKYIATLGIIETVLGILKLADQETLIASLQFLETLTDDCTPILRTRLMIRSGIKSLISTLKIEDKNIDVKLYVTIVLTILERIFYHQRSKVLIYKNAKLLTNALNQLKEICPLNYTKRIQTMQDQLLSIEQIFM